MVEAQNLEPSLSRSPRVPRQQWLFAPHFTTTTSINPRRARPPRNLFGPRASSITTPKADEDSFPQVHLVSTKNPITLLHVVSFAFLAVVLLVQFYFTDTFPINSKTPQRYSSTAFSPSANFVERDTCESPPPFPTEPPISRPHTMALAAEVKRVVDEFRLSDEDALKIVEEFRAELDEGLAVNGSQMSQIPTYVTAVPNGTEKGLYLAVDLGGTNFRVCSIQLNGDRTFGLKQEKVPIPRELMQAKTAKELFEFLAKQIGAFMSKHHSDHFEKSIKRRQTLSTPEGYRDEHIFRLGFTFSFPVHQIGINRGTLIRWTKGFDIPDAIGQDVCELLQKEIDLLGLPIKVAALVNDTVGTLMARSYTSPGKTGTLLGAIFGTGTNGAYVEKVSKITKPMEGEYDKTTGEMVVNTEWGSFDNSLKVLPTTKYDEILDRGTPNPGVQMFEKRISGMFLGEILRIALVEMMNKPDVPLFRDDNSSHNDLKSTTTVDTDSPLQIPWAVDSEILSYVEDSQRDGLKSARQAITKFLGVSSPSLEDAQAVKDIAHAIAERAARLAGIAVAAIVLNTGRLNPGSSTTSLPKSTAAITEDVKNLNLVEAASATASKLANAAGLDVNEEDIVDIGVDGSLVEFYPGFQEYMRDIFRAIPEIGAVGEKKIRIGIARDGSGVGAALIALVAAQMERANDYIGDFRPDLRQRLSVVGEQEQSIEED